MSEHIRRCPLPEDVTHQLLQLRAKSLTMAADPNNPIAQARLRTDRIDLVRRYLHNPSGWPDGIDWPNWKGEHEIWFTGHEEEWIPLAVAEQERRDLEAKRAEQAPKRKPLIPDTKAPERVARASTSFFKNAERILKDAKAKAKARTEAEHTATSKADVAPVTKKPVTEKVTQNADVTEKRDVTQNAAAISVTDPSRRKARGRPRTGALSSAERMRRKRQRDRK